MKQKLQGLAYILFILVITYVVISGVFFRFSNPHYTDTEIFLEIVTFGNYERTP